MRSPHLSHFNQCVGVRRARSVSVYVLKTACTILQLVLKRFKPVVCRKYCIVVWILKQMRYLLRKYVHIFKLWWIVRLAIIVSNVCVAISFKNLLLAHPLPTVPQSMITYRLTAFIESVTRQHGKTTDINISFHDWWACLLQAIAINILLSALYQGSLLASASQLCRTLTFGFLCIPRSSAFISAAWLYHKFWLTHKNFAARKEPGEHRLTYWPMSSGLHGAYCRSGSTSDQPVSVMPVPNGKIRYIVL